MLNSRFIAALDRRLVRRLTIAPLVIIAALVALALSPLALVVAVASDLVTNRDTFRRTRVYLLVLGVLIVETLGIAGAFLAWLVSGLGKFGSPRWRWHLHRAGMGRYTSAMLTLITRTIGTRVIWRDRDDLTVGPFVMIARHTSFFDAVIPATVVSRRNQLLGHHVVTHGLRYAPCIDIVGHRYPNRFIKRTPGEGSGELVKIEHVGSLLDRRSAGVIFPEGTFRSPDRHQRAVRRLRRRHRDLAARAEKLRHVLPPRANGLHAFLQGAPDADVVVCVNTGFEQFGSIRAILDRPVTTRPILVETWRIERHLIPDDPEAFHTWLFETYVEIDAWVERSASVSVPTGR